MKTNILDQAFVLRKQNSSPTAERAATAEIQSQFPNATAQEIADAYSKVDHLISFACKWADELRGPSNDGNGIPTVNLQEQCPGFSDGTYSSAEAWGLYLTK